MTISDEDIRRRLRLGEDSCWAFKPIKFDVDTPIHPSSGDLADELGAFANADGGELLCGVSDDGRIQGMSRAQMQALDHLLVEISTDSIEPALRIRVHHRELDERAFVLVEVPRGNAAHERDGRVFIRVGSTKRRMESNERPRLAQIPTQSHYLWFDRQVVPQTGFETLSERLWEPLLSVSGAADPRRGLLNLRLLAQDEDALVRATVAGILLRSQSPQEWLPQASIVATHYRGEDRATGQLDAQEIAGPLPDQISDAVRFVARNIRVAARKKVPQRVDLPAYSMAAVFEAVVNAVAHRDYSVSSRRIRLSMFRDRLDVDSRGQLPNGMNIEGMETSQATRNEVIASVFGRLPVGKIPGSSHRGQLMERRGDGVSIIRKETLETGGVLPEYRIIDRSNVVLSIPAARLVLSPADATITVHVDGKPLAGVDVLALFPNKTWQRATTDEAGDAVLDLYTVNLPMTVFAAAPGYAAGLKHEWRPHTEGLLLELVPLPSGCAAIFPEAAGQIPGLRGRLNAKRDSTDRTYLYADNIAIDEGRQQPVPFRLGKAMRLTDAYGAESLVTIIDIVGRATLVEYQSLRN